jgi:cell wall-associated NlpC family hydrolase
LPDSVQGAIGAPITTPLRVAARRPFTLLFVALTLALTMVVMEAPAVFGSTTSAPAAAAKGSQAARVLRAARSHIGARFRMGAEGQKIGRRTYFDCSGFVYKVYKEAGLIAKIGGGRFLGTTYWNWFKRRGLANRKNPKPGDIIMWGKQGKATHMGIYMGDNRAISALVNPWGVRIHRVNGLAAGAHNRRSLRVLAYLHVRLER